MGVNGQRECPQLPEPMMILERYLRRGDDVFSVYPSGFCDQAVFDAAVSLRRHPNPNEQLVSGLTARHRLVDRAGRCRSSCPPKQRRCASLNPRVISELVIE